MKVINNSSTVIDFPTLNGDVLHLESGESQVTDDLTARQVSERYPFVVIVPEEDSVDEKAAPIEEEVTSTPEVESPVAEEPAPAASKKKKVVRRKKAAPIEEL